MKRLQLLFVEILDVDKGVARAPGSCHEFVEFQLNGQGVLVLRTLYEKHHQERHHRRPGVDDELPRIRKPEQRS